MKNKTKKQCRHIWIPYVVPAYETYRGRYVNHFSPVEKKLCSKCGESQMIYFNYEKN